MPCASRKLDDASPHALFDEVELGYLEPWEEAALLARCAPELRQIVEFAMHTALRQGAILGLRWRQVDERTRTIRVPKSLDKAKHGYVVPINSRVAEILGERRKVGREADGFVFGKRDGCQRRSISWAFKSACERAGVRDFVFHDLRHDAASRVVIGGGSLYDAKALLGHRSSAMTERYAHLSPDHMRKVGDLTLRRATPEPQVVDLEEARRGR